QPSRLQSVLASLGWFERGVDQAVRTTRVMTYAFSRINFATRRRGVMLRAALFIGICNFICFAQTPAGTPIPPAKAPLTDDERTELLNLIRGLQERVEKLEAAQAAGSQTGSAQIAAPEPLSNKPDPSTSDDPHVWMPPVVKEKPVSES